MNFKQICPLPECIIVYKVQYLYVPIVFFFFFWVFRSVFVIQLISLQHIPLVWKQWGCAIMSGCALPLWHQYILYNFCNKSWIANHCFHIIGPCNINPESNEHNHTNVMVAPLYLANRSKKPFYYIISTWCTWVPLDSSGWPLPNNNSIISSVHNSQIFLPIFHVSSLQFKQS